MSIPAAAESEEIFFDKYESEFNELISLSKELLERQPVGISDDEQTSPFTFGTGVIACLHITITKCRYHMLRREVLRASRNISAARRCLGQCNGGCYWKMGHGNRRAGSGGWGTYP